jgi:O-antigen polysaccharide polymerase Wzy
MTPLEIFIVGTLTLLVAFPIVRGYSNREKTLFWSPLTIFAAVYCYYFLIGPLICLRLGQTVAYNMDFRDSMWKAWLAGTLSLASIYTGFAVSIFHFKRRLAPEITSSHKTQLRLFCFALAAMGLVGFAYYVITTGRSVIAILTPLAPSSENLANSSSGLAAGNYLFLLINAFTPAICIWYVLNANKSFLARLFLVGLPAVLVVFFYTTLGFRHRIIIMAAALAATIFLLRGTRPNPLALLGGCAGLVLTAGLIVLTRTYNQGLDLSLLKGMGVVDVFLGGLNDASTFFTLAMAMDWIPAHMPFIGIEPFWVAATIPIPRALWANKPEPNYLWALNELAGTQGQAVPSPGEHYMMFGWPGIIIGGLVIGIIYRGFWNFYRANPSNPIVVVIYSVSFGLCFPLINRGYLAQTLMEYFFALLPVVALFLMSRASMTLPVFSGNTITSGESRGKASNPGRRGSR